MTPFNYNFTNDEIRTIDVSKPVTKYVTTDHQQYDTREEANIHEVELRLKLAIACGDIIMKDRDLNRISASNYKENYSKILYMYFECSDEKKLKEYKAMIDALFLHLYDFKTFDTPNILDNTRFFIKVDKRKSKMYFPSSCICEINDVEKYKGHCFSHFVSLDDKFPIKHVDDNIFEGEGE